MSERVDRGKVVQNGEITYLSPSGISKGDPTQTGGCARRWHWNYVAGKKEPFTGAQQTGVETHSQIEHYLRTGEKTLGPIALAGREWIPEPTPNLLIEHDIGDGMLTAAGVPVIGYVDLIKPYPQYVDARGDHQADPEGTVEIIDWKTTGDLNRIKSGHDLLQTVQMATYAQWAIPALGASHVRLSHVYFRTKGAPQARKSTKLHTAQEIATRWEQIEGVARSLIQIAKVKSERSNDVEPNTSACNAWGGCPHRDYCRVGAASSMESLFGKTGAAALKGESEMSLLAKLQAPTAPATVAGAPDPAVELSLKAEMARLADEQRRASVPAGFADACTIIEKSGRGFPALSGKGADAWRALKNIEGTGGLAGSGFLGGLTLSDPAALTQLAQELTEAAPAAPPALLPPDAPESDPALAAKPVEGYSAPVAPAPADAPKKRGRPRKADAPPVTMREAPSDAPVEALADGIVLFVDCIPSGPFDRLEPYIEDLCARLCKEYGAADIRCAPGDGPLSFGKWKGALAACAREMPPAAGTYVLLSQSEPAQVVADALRGVCETYVRGVR